LVCITEKNLATLGETFSRNAKPFVHLLAAEKSSEVALKKIRPADL
jgi:hypothetical protein